MYGKDFAMQVRAAFVELKKVLIGYDQILLQAMFALVTREHVLWYAPPGRAKSMAAELIFGLFPDASRLELQFTGDTTPEQVFGHVIPERLIQSGEEVRNLDGGIADVDFAFLDEVLDAPDYLLRALLNILNERVYRAKGQPTLDAPLHSAIATTNFMRQGPALEAVLDRFMVRAVVPAVEELVDHVSIGHVYLDTEGKNFELPVLSYEDLVRFADYIERPDSITVSPGMQLLHMLLIQEYRRRRYAVELTKWKAQNNADVHADDVPTEEELGLDVTQRRVAKLYDFVRASAALNDRNHIMLDDLRAAGFGLMVIGDGRGHEGVWKQTCDDLLKLTSEHLEELDELGREAMKLAELKSEYGLGTNAEYQIGGVLPAKVKQALSKFRGKDKHPTIRLVCDELEQTLKGVDHPRITTGYTLDGWR